MRVHGDVLKTTSIYDLHHVFVCASECAHRSVTVQKYTEIHRNTHGGRDRASPRGTVIGKEGEKSSPGRLGHNL